MYGQTIYEQSSPHRCFREHVIVILGLFHLTAPLEQVIDCHLDAKSCIFFLYTLKIGIFILLFGIKS